MKKAFVFVLLLFLLPLSGCRKNPQKAASHLVTGVEISCHKEDVQLHRYYSDQQKMAYVLLYLRLLEPGKSALHAADRSSGEIYRITVSHDDGSKTEYRQKDHRYFSSGGKHWQLIDPAQAEGLYRILRNVPGDTL